MMRRGDAATRRRRDGAMRRGGVLLIAASLLIGSVAFAHEGLHEQIAEVTRRIARDPTNARLYLQRGELHRLHGDAKLALRDYSRAEKFDPQLSAVDLGRARLHFEAKRYEQAERALDRFVKAEPDHADGAILRARTLAALGSVSDAIAEWERASRLNKNPTPEFFIDWARAVPQIDKAIAVLDHGIVRLGPLVTLELAAVDLELRRQNYDAALARIDLLAKQSPRKESWVTRKGEILLAANRVSDACRAFDEASQSLNALSEARRRTRATMALQQRIDTGRARCD